MIALRAIFDVVPWWTWVLAIIAVVLVTALGAWPLVIAFAKRSWPVIRALWPVWLIIAAAIGFAIWLDSHDQLLTKRVTDERDAFWKKREADAKTKFEAKIAALNRKLEIASSAADAAARKAAEDIARAKRERDVANTELEKQRSRNVTPEANRMCTLTRGVILQFNAGASSANGQHDPFARDPAAGAGAELVDAAAGVSLDTYSRAAEATQRALGDCRAQVTGWQAYYHSVIEPWSASVLAALSSFPTKGATP